MKTDSIEQMIAERFALSSGRQLRELIAVIAENRGQVADPATLDAGVAFIRSYIQQVPYMIKVGWTAACTVGLEKEMQGILEAAISYWEQDIDIIPDHIGVIGLMDDAYCSMTSLQAVSDHFQLQTGKLLFPTDLSSANRLMRELIGDPYGSELDQLVLKSLADACVMDAVKAMASQEKQLNFENQGTIWHHDAAEIMDTTVASKLGIDA